MREQPSQHSVILKDPETGALVDHGAFIPLDQILAGTRRSHLSFTEDSEVRPISQMLGVDRTSQGGIDPTSRREGWGGLARGQRIAYRGFSSGEHARELTVGRVLVGDDSPALFRHLGRYEGDP